MIANMAHHVEVILLRPLNFSSERNYHDLSWKEVIPEAEAEMEQVLRFSPSP